MSARIVFNALSPAGRSARLSILIFHRVLSEPDPLLPSEPDVERFRSQMQRVGRWFNVLPLGEAAAKLRTGSLPARSLVITLDDGYADNYFNALPILRELGLPATCFVATGYLDGGRMWNDTVIEAVRGARKAELDLEALQLGRYSLDSNAARIRAIDQLLARMKYFSLEQREALADAVAEQAEAILPRSPMLSIEQLIQLRKGGMEIGAHTVRHPILSAVSPERARSEIVEGKRTLERILGEPVRLFAYPNGKPDRDYRAEHVRMVREAGFDAALSTAWGAARYGCDLFQLPRFTPWDRRPLSYALRMAGNLRRPDYAMVAA